MYFVLWKSGKVITQDDRITQTGKWNRIQLIKLCVVGKDERCL